MPGTWRHAADPVVSDGKRSGLFMADSPRAVPARSAWWPTAPQIGQRFAPTLDELAQNGKLRGRFIAVRSIQRPAQPRQRVQTDARLEGRPHEAQPLQAASSEQAIAAQGARHRTQQSAQQVVAHDMHAHPGIKGQPGHGVGVIETSF